jgi:NAD+ synthase (glutamine-hydrolysing)
MKNHLICNLGCQILNKVLKMDRTYKHITAKLREYAKEYGFEKAILGLSGGIDSALTAAISVGAFGNKNVLGVMMPGPYSTTQSLTDAEKLAFNLKIEHKIIPIISLYDEYLKVIKPHIEGRSFDVTEENIQARIRANILFALSNKFGYLVLATGNKSEAMVGYATLYGDLAGGICPIGDIYKTEVYKLADYINEMSGWQVIPQEILKKDPSAELSPGQKDTDSLPPYKILDEILKAKIEKGVSDNEIAKKGFELATVQKVAKMVEMSEFKRSQAPPSIIMDKT